VAPHHEAAAALQQVELGRRHGAGGDVRVRNNGPDALAAGAGLADVVGGGADAPKGDAAPVRAVVKKYVEVWDYAGGGARFRGFVADQDGESTLFVFFDRDIIGRDLKHGLMALLELASSDGFSCSQLVVCVDRSANPEDTKDLTKDLGWIGFELVMLDEWSEENGCISDRWLLLGMGI